MIKEVGGVIAKDNLIGGCAAGTGRATRGIECESEKGGGKVQKSPQRSCKVRVRWLQQLEIQRGNCWYNNWYKLAN
jgi:hypothetical protein